MENIHGIDVSWLHKPNNGTRANTSSPITTEDSQIASTSKPELKNVVINNLDGIRNSSKDQASKSVSSTDQETAFVSSNQPDVKPGTRRPGLLGRTSTDKLSSSETTGAIAPVLKKRSSWMSSLSSKLSSSGNSKAAGQSKGYVNVTTSSTGPNGSTTRQADAESQMPTIGDNIGTRTSTEEGGTEEIPSKVGSGSFFSSTLRRLSSGIPSQMPAGAQASVPQCQRRILNIDQGRPRATVDGLNTASLRRVSFSVDVEIAGSSRYPVDEDLNEDAADAKWKKRDKKLKERAEGEALKQPEVVKAAVEEERASRPVAEDTRDDSTKPNFETEKESQTVAHANFKDRAAVKSSYAADTNQPQNAIEQLRESTDKEAVGLGPASHAGQTEPTHSTEVKPMSQPVATNAHHKSKDKPTTDPLRVYRRCCQLREAPVLKRISEQLGSPTNCGVEAPGIVTCLNLNRSRMQLSDIICLGDWLAVVPVKRLLLDDANLTDEGLRIILAGLLAAKPPELNRRKRVKSSPTRLRDNTINRTPGVIEKLTLKNNRKLTIEAWRHICTFLNLSKSIKAVDLSMIPFPQAAASIYISSKPGKETVDLDELLYQSISTRLGGERLVELTFGECGLEDGNVAKIASAASKIHLQRLGLAGNKISATGLECVASYLSAGSCKGLDLAGVDLHNKLPIVLGVLNDSSPLQAISVANCNIEVQDLQPTFEKLITLPDFRFLDLSHNRKLFSQQVTALSVLRHYLPRLHLLKRLHLMDVSLSPADAIGIAEIVPEMRNLAHLNILENSQLTSIASATDSASSEEACALYASLMTSVRLSKTMACVDVDVPGKEASEVVRALARQVVAYCLRNMEVFTQGDAIRVADAAAALPDVSGTDTGLLKDIAGEEDGSNIEDMPAAAKSEDYLVGGQGWVKALSYCLNAADLRRMSLNGSSTPTQVIESEAGKAKAKEMSKDLLTSARNFRQRLQTVLAREEASNGDTDVLKRLHFLDQTIISIIERFEREYPDTRLPAKPQEDLSQLGDTEPIDLSSLLYASSPPTGETLRIHDRSPNGPISSINPASTSSSRRSSATDMASFALAAEEAKFHKLGHRFRRDVLPPSGQDDQLYGTTSHDPEEQKYLSDLRKQMENLDSDELREKVQRQGWEATLKEFREEKERLKIEERDRGSIGN